MTSDKVQALASMTTRQKATAAVVVLVVLILIWQISSMFGGGGAPARAPTVAKPTAMKAGAPGDASTPGGAMQPTITPKVVDVAQITPTTQREAELIALQQETQAKYLKALNELQVLRVSKEIAVTNKDISSARLAKVVSEKKIVDLLQPAAPPPTSEAINKNMQTTTAQIPVSSMGDQEVRYAVVSVSQLQYKWSAVLGYKGTIFNVHVGDVLPPDGSIVSSIAKDGVVLEKDGNKKKVSILAGI